MKENNKQLPKNLRKSQSSEILKYMKKHRKGITSMEAINLFGATRLSGIIFNLKKQGHSIITKSEVVRTRYGNRTTIARYVLVEPKGDKCNEVHCKG